VTRDEQEILDRELEHKRKLDYERELIADQDKWDIIKDSRS
jgi:hypothetical protein